MRKVISMNVDLELFLNIEALYIASVYCSVYPAGILQSLGCHFHWIMR